MLASTPTKWATLLTRMPTLASPSRPRRARRHRRPRMTSQRSSCRRRSGGSSSAKRRCGALSACTKQVCSLSENAEEQALLVGASSSRRRPPRALRWSRDAPALQLPRGVHLAATTGRVAQFGPIAQRGSFRHIFREHVHLSDTAAASACAQPQQIWQGGSGRRQVRAVEKVGEHKRGRHGTGTVRRPQNLSQVSQLCADQ